MTNGGSAKRIASNQMNFVYSADRRIKDRETHNGNRDEDASTAAKSRYPQETHKVRSPAIRGLTRDITEEFTSASTFLQSGQLVKDEFFTLFEAVGALEIMDPKMDAGVIPEGDTFDAAFDCTAILAAEEIIWIMDRLMCLEIIWHDGYPLSQTIYTSVHIARLLSPDNSAPYAFDIPAQESSVQDDSALVRTVLRAYCVGLVKCCHHVLNIIQSQNYYEEEDFVTHLFGRELLPQMDNDSALKLLGDAMESLTNENLPQSLQQALAVRLSFRRSMLIALADDGSAWGEVVDRIKVICADHEHARPTPAAFSDKVQRQLATSTPPRPMPQITWEECIRRWSDLCSDVLEARRLTDSAALLHPYSLHRATWSFSSREPRPGTYARAVFQDRLFAEQMVAGTISQFDLLLTDIRNLVLAGDTLASADSFLVEVPTDPRHISARLTADFMERAIDEYVNLYRMVCQNRCRIRRTFTQSISILDALQTEASRMDQELDRVVTSQRSKGVPLAPFTSWTKFHKLRIMAWTVQLGVETDIYTLDELGGTYWFLSCISNDQIRLLNHIEQFLLDRMRRRTSGKNMDDFAAECQDAQWLLQSLRLWATCTKQLSEALWHFYSVLVNRDIIRTFPRNNAQRQLCYEARMKPFLTMTNDRVPNAEEFETARQTATGRPLPQSCRFIDAQCKAAKAVLAELKKMSPQQGKYEGTEEQWRKEIKGLETICVATAVSATQLSRMVDKSGEHEVGRNVDCQVENRWHPWWAVPQIKGKKLN